jgi:PEP-CTERM motif
MSCILQKRIWLAGASLLAIVLGSGDANAFVFGTVGAEYTVPSTGYYDFTVAGAQGGASSGGGAGGNGAAVGGELFFDAGDTLNIVVGGPGGQGFGGNGGYGGGGGGGSFVFGGSLLFAAAGGAGAFWDAGPGSTGSPGIGHGGHPAGPASYGGAGGIGVNFRDPDATPAQAGSFPYGGAGARGNYGAGPSGGYGGGGGGGYDGGGGGGGAAGVRGYGGGYSYVISTARDPFGITGGGDGYVSINFVAAPEPSTWALMLLGFSGLGFMGWRSQRSRAPATI